MDDRTIHLDPPDPDEIADAQAAAEIRDLAKGTPHDAACRFAERLTDRDIADANDIGLICTLLERLGDDSIFRAAFDEVVNRIERGHDAPSMGYTL